MNGRLYQLTILWKLTGVGQCVHRHFAHADKGIVQLLHLVVAECVAVLFGVYFGLIEDLVSVRC